MEKKSLLSANWLKAALLLMVMCFSGLYARANTTNTVDLDYLEPGQTYTIDANTIVTGRYFADYDGTITLTSSVSANTNFVPYTDNTYSDIIESVRDEEARTKTFVFVAGNRGATVYFKSVVSTTPYEVRFDYVRASNLEDYVESIVPEEGSVVSSLKDFTINFTTKIYGARNNAQLYKGETLVAEKALEYKANVNTYSFSFDEEITEPGDYTLVFPEESFVCGSGMKGSSEWRFNYTIVAPQPEMIVSLVGGNTAEEAVTISNPNVTVTFNNVASASVVSEWTSLGLFSVVPGSSIETCYVEYSVTKVSDTEYILTPNADQLAELGDAAYKFKIPAGYFRYDDGSLSEAYETWVKYEAPSFDPVTISFSPAGGSEDVPTNIEVADISNFTLSFSGAESVAASVASTKEESAIYLKFWNDYWQDWDNAIAFKPEFTDAFTCKLVPFDEYWASNIEMLASGKYQLCIPAGTFVYNGDETNVNVTTSAYYKLVLPDVTVSPEPGSIIEVVDNSGLMNVYVRFNNETQVTASQTVKATLKKDGVVLEEVLGQVNWGQRNTLAFWFATNHIEAGEYEFIVPGDIVTLGSGKAFEGLTATYTIVGATSAKRVVITPEGGETEETAVEIYNLDVNVASGQGETITWPTQACDTAFQQYDPVDQTWNNISYWVQYEDNGDGTVRLYNNYPGDFGIYRLHIPAGEFYYGENSEDVNEEINLYYKLVQDPNAPAMVITPERGTTLSMIDNETIIVEFKNVTNVEMSSDVASGNSTSIALTKDGYFYSYLKPVAIEGETNKFRLVDQGNNGGNTVSLPIIQEGVYGIYIAYGAFIMDGESNEYTWNQDQFIVDGSLDTNPVIRLTPEEGTVLSKIDDDTFILTIEKANEVSINEEKFAGEYPTAMGITVDSKFVQLMKPVAIEGETNKFKLVSIGGDQSSVIAGYRPYPLEQEGVYGVYIEDGAFIVDGSAYPTSMFWKTEYVTVKKEAKMIVTPENGGAIESYEDIRISFEGVSNVEINPSALNADMGKVMLIPDDNWMNSVVVKPVAVEGETNTFKLEIIDGEFPASFNSVLFFMEEGSFWMDGADSPMIEYTYTQAAAQPEMIVTPENGAMFDVIDGETFRVTFKGVENATINPAFADWNGDPLVTLYSLTPEGYAGTMTSLKPVAVEGATNEFKFEVFAEAATQFPITENGTWCLWIPEGTFTMDGIPSPDFGAEYTLAPYKYTAEPAEGYVLSLDAVSLTFEPGVEGVNKDVEGEVVLYKDNEEVETVALADLTLAGWGASGSSLVIPFSKVYTQAGEYRVEIPANVVQLTGGISNEAITLNYTIGGITPDWTAVADPAPGVVEEITTIMVTFQGVSQLTVDSAAGPNDFPYYATIAEDGTLTKVPYSVFTFLEGANQISLTVQNEESKLSEPGKYAFIIPATYCLVDGVQMTEDVRFDYEIEGAQPEYEVVITPSTGEIVKGDQLYVITVTFEGAKSIELDGSKAATLYQIDEFGGAMTNIYVTTSCEGNVATFNVNELHKPYLDAAGTFQFTIPVGMVIITDANDVVGKNKENIVATWESEGLSVDTIGVDAKDLNIYSVNGMLIKRNGTYEDVKSLEQGIYIINGKKYYVK